MDAGSRWLREEGRQAATSGRSEGNEVRPVPELLSELALTWTTASSRPSCRSRSAYSNSGSPGSSLRRRPTYCGSGCAAGAAGLAARGCASPPSPWLGTTQWELLPELMPAVLHAQPRCAGSGTMSSTTRSPRCTLCRRSRTCSSCASCAVAGGVFGATVMAPSAGL